MATWHQQRAGLAGLFTAHESKWKFVSNPPNDCAAVGLYETEQAAQDYMAGLRKHQGEDYVRHCRIIPPAAPLIPGQHYACGCGVQDGQTSCRAHGPGIVRPFSLYRVSYMEQGRSEATGYGRDRAEREKALANFRRNGRAWRGAHG